MFSPLKVLRYTVIQRVHSFTLSEVILQHSPHVDDLYWKHLHMNVNRHNDPASTWILHCYTHNVHIRIEMFCMGKKDGVHFSSYV